MDAIPESEKAKIIIQLAEAHIEKLGPVGALERGAAILIDAVRNYAPHVKAAQEKGLEAVEMTPEVINAFNEMLWGCGLLVAIAGKKHENPVN